jgi:uncharacterized protein
VILDLRVFDEYPAETTIYADPIELGSIDECLLQIKAAAVELAIQKSADEYYCQGQVTTRVVVECARCLGEFETDLVGEVSFVLCAEKEAQAHGGSDDEEYVCFQGNDLRADIVVPVRQALVLSMPMKPLCSEGCRGLCPMCGANLNERTCDCKNETPDPRWNGLKRLLPDQ